MINPTSAFFFKPDSNIIIELKELKGGPANNQARNMLVLATLVTPTTPKCIIRPIPLNSDSTNSADPVHLVTTGN